MSLVHQQVLDANLRYAREFGAKAGLALPRARRFAILTCMDARLDPARFAGLAEGDAHVVRNAASEVTPAYPYWHQRQFAERNPSLV